MVYGTMIRERREQFGWTQRQLAEAVGCTDGYVAHIENEVKLPSLDISMALAQAFQLSIEEQQRFLEAVEEARRQRSEQRIRARSVAVRGALRTHSSSGTSSQEPVSHDIDAATIACDLAADPTLSAAYGHLKTALADARMRDTVLNALRAFAQASEPR